MQRSQGQWVTRNESSYIQRTLRSEALAVNNNPALLGAGPTGFLTVTLWRYTPKTFLFSSVLRPNQRYHNEIKVLLFGRVLHCVTFSTMSDDGPPFVTVRIQFV